MYRSITNFEQHNFSYYDDIFTLFLMINSKTNPMEDVLKYVVEELVEKKQLLKQQQESTVLNEVKTQATSLISPEASLTRGGKICKGHRSRKLSKKKIENTANLKNLKLTKKSLRIVNVRINY